MCVILSVDLRVQLLQIFWAYYDYEMVDMNHKSKRVKEISGESVWEKLLGFGEEK